jgi:hypothetical protein
MNFLVKKSHADGTLTAIKASLAKTEVSVFLMEVMGDDFDPTFSSRVAEHIKDKPETPFNILFDLSHANNPAHWASVIGGVMLNEKLGGVDLPPETQLITVIKDIDADLPMYLQSHSVHVPAEHIDKLGEMVASFRSEKPQKETAKARGDEPEFGR